MSASSPIACDLCGYDARRWSDERVSGTLRVMGGLWRGYLEGVDPLLADTRPDPHTWSILEYADHVREAAWNGRFLVDLALAEPGVDLGPPVVGGEEIGLQRRFTDPVATLGSMATATTDLFAALVKLDAAAWDTPMVVHGATVDIRHAAHHVLHEALHHLRDVGRIRAALGDGVRPQSGAVVHLAAGPGGVPKPAVASLNVGAAGIEGDHQNDELHHGRPFQAVCLWGADVLSELRAEGHPIEAGAAGENITIGGVAWDELRPGAKVLVGSTVELELSSYAIPCAKNAQWFVDRNFRRIDHDHHAGWSRIYAWVRRAGTVNVGDAVEILP